MIAKTKVVLTAYVWKGVLTNCMGRYKKSRAVRKQKNGKTNNQIYIDKSHRSNQGSSAQNMKVNDSEQTGLQMEYAAVRDETILLMEEHNNQ